MQCLKCRRELPEGAAFCGRCGTPVPAKPPPEEPRQKKRGTAPQKSKNSEASPQKAKKRRTGLKILAGFAAAAIVLGAALGFLVARGVIDLRGLLSADRFVWTDFSEGDVEREEEPEIPEGEEKKEPERESGETDVSVLPE